MPAPKPKSSPAKASKKQHENSSKVEGKQKPLGPRARALEAVKRFAPEHLDTVKKTKWVLELVQGLIADNDVACEALQAQQATELAAAKQETADSVAEGLETAGKLAQAKEVAAALQAALEASQVEVQMSKQALEQAEMTAVVAATECVNMQKIAQAGSQGDKKARRVLSLRAHNLKENLLKAKTDLKAQKAAVRQQAFQIEVMSNQQETAAEAACQLAEQMAQQQLAAKQAVKQSRSQSQSRLYQPKSTEDKPETAPPERPSTAARSVAALPAPVSPHRPKLIKAAAKQAVAADAAATNQLLNRPKLFKAAGSTAVNADAAEQVVKGTNESQAEQSPARNPARMSPWGDTAVFFDTGAPFASPQPLKNKTCADVD